VAYPARIACPARTANPRLRDLKTVGIRGRSETVAAVCDRRYSVDEFWERFPKAVAPSLPARAANPGRMDW